MEFTVKGITLIFALLCITNAYSFDLSALLKTHDEKSICGQDDRVPSRNLKVARGLGKITDTGGCTLTMISKSCAISAGHCRAYLGLAEFNVPASVGGRIQHPSKEDIYQIEDSSVVHEYTGIGNDYAVFKVKPNAITGRYAGDVQGFYTVSFKAPVIGDEIRITGFGLDRSEPTRNLAQQTHTGLVSKITRGSSALYHKADTMGGNSGSSIIVEGTQTIVGIHTNGGCSSRGGQNAATMIAGHTKLTKAIKACLASE